MAYRGFRLALVFIVIVSSGMSFLALRGLDETAVIGPGAVLRVNGTENRASTEEVAATITGFARSHGVDVAREVPDLARPEEARTLYLALSGHSSDRRRWLTDGYPNFSRGIATHVRPAEQSPMTDPRGTYLIFGSTAEAQALADALAGIGLHGRVTPFVTTTRTLQFFGHGAFLWCFLVSGLVVVALVAAAVLGNAKTYGVLRLHGNGPLRCAIYDVRLTAQRAALPLATTAVGVTLALWWYNRAHHFVLFLLVDGGFVLAFTILAVLGYVVALAQVWRTSVQDSLKGRLNTATPMVGSHICRCLAITACIAVGLGCLDALTALSRRSNQDRLWHQAGSTSAVLLNGSLGRQSERLDTEIGAWLQARDRQGDVIVTAPATLGRLGVSASPQTPVLVVNDAYLQRHSVPIQHGTRLRADAHGVTIAMPRSAPRGLDREVKAWLDLIGVERSAPARMTGLRTNTQLFTYGAGVTADTGSPTLRDPIVVALPTTPVVSSSQYTAWATQHAVLFPDPTTVMQARSRDEKLHTDILGVEAVASRAAMETRSDMRNLQLGLWNLAASVTVVVMSALCSSMLTFLSSAQVIFARFLHGWAWPRIHRRLLAVEALLATLLVVAACWGGLRTRVHPAPGDPDAPLPWYAGPVPIGTAALAFSALATTSSLLTMKRLTARQIREVSAHA